MARIGILYGDDNKKGGIRAYSHMLGTVLKRNGHIVKYIHFGKLNNPFYKSPTSGWRELMLTYELGIYADYISPQIDLIIGNGYYGAFCKHSQITIFHFSYPSYVKHLKLNPIKGLVGGYLEYIAGREKIKVAVSKFLAEEIRKFYGYSAIVVSNGVDTSVFYTLSESELQESYKQFNLSPEKPIISFVGRWNKRKGADVLEYLANQLNGVQFVAVLGYGSINPNIPPNVKVFQQLDHIDINKIYNISNLVLYPSRYEPFGYVTVEGWSAGTPVITTDMGVGYELKDIIPFKRFIISKEDLYDKTLEIAKWYLSLSKEEREEIAQEGAKYVRNKYNLEKWAKNIKYIIHYAIEKYL